MAQDEAVSVLDISRYQENHDFTTNEMEQFLSLIGDTPYDVNIYDVIIEILSKPEIKPIGYLRHIRLLKLKTFALSLKEIDQWLQDELTEEDLSQRNLYVGEFFNEVLSTYPDKKYWLKFVEWCEEKDEFESMLMRAYEANKYDFKESDYFWQLLLAYKMQHFEHKGEEELSSFYVERLEIPHFQIDETFSSYSAFVSKYCNTKYEILMKTSQKIYSQTKKFQAGSELFEMRLLEDSTDPQLWIEYLEFESKRPKKQRNLDYIGGVFKRSLDGRSGDSEWIPVWLSYFYIMYAQDSSVNVSLEIYVPMFVRHYPTSAISWAEYFRNYKHIGSRYLEFEDARDLIISLVFPADNSYDNWKTLALSILTYEFTEVKSDNLDMLTALYTDISSFVRFAIEENNDIFHSVERLSTQIYEFLEDYDQARGLLQQLTSTFKEQCENWLFYHDFEKRHGDYESSSKVLKAAARHCQVMDWPERILQEWISYEQVFGSPESQKFSLIIANKEIIAVNKKRIAEYEQSTKSQEAQVEVVEVEDHRKRVLEEDENVSTKRHKPDTPKRDREHLSLKVNNLPEASTEEEIIEYFQECGEIKNVSVTKKDNLAEAIIEFSSERGLLAGLTKDKKLFKSYELEVSRAVNCTVWCTNFPPDKTQDSIKAMFEGIGDVLEIRFPSLKTNSQRRFCYVEYASSRLSLKAVESLHGKNLSDLKGKNYTLVVKISEPEKKQSRRDPTQEGREIYLQNLNFQKTDTESLRELFVKFGEIEKIVLPLNERNKKSGHKCDGYGFIIFSDKESALQAMSVNGTELHGRGISVSIAQPKSKPSNRMRTGGRLNDISTISLLNISDTINEGQVRGIFGHLGEIKAVELHPALGGVLIEFSDPADAGKAAMMMEGKEFNGRSLEIGTKSDLLKKKSEPIPRSEVPTIPISTKMMVPPSLLRRRKRI